MNFPAKYKRVEKVKPVQHFPNHSGKSNLHKYFSEVAIVKPMLSSPYIKKGSSMVKKVNNITNVCDTLSKHALAVSCFAISNFSIPNLSMCKE
ncbi:hypothetical protein CEAn_00451 [Coxiella endosymbiont of Amblyomma nuttalli]|nr:hypothetical protein CEAn_00451 [Coxiella endosymbiont of Amblyomma nuttalli]